MLFRSAIAIAIVIAAAVVVAKIVRANYVEIAIETVVDQVEFD